MLLAEFLFLSGKKKNQIYIFCISNNLYLQEHPINNMKKELFDTTAFLSFFIRIPCKTNALKSVQCKPGASRSARPNNKFSRAYNNGISAANTGSDAKVRSIGGHLLNIRYAAFCDSLLALTDAYRLAL
jgi:hypothetical protein